MVYLSALRPLLVRSSPAATLTVNCPAHAVGSSLVREFVTLPSKHNHFNHGLGVTRFEYYDEEHPDLQGKIAMLDNAGYIRDVREREIQFGACPKSSYD